MRKSNVHGFAIRRQRRAIGIMVAVLLPVLTGFLGLALALGRLYNRKAEMQAVADVVAISAAKKLHGTSDGIDAALAAAHDVVESGDGSTTMPYYGYWPTMTFSDGAYRDRWPPCPQGHAFRTVRDAQAPGQSLQGKGECGRLFRTDRVWLPARDQ